MKNQPDDIVAGLIWNTAKLSVALTVACSMILACIYFLLASYLNPIIMAVVGVVSTLMLIHYLTIYARNKLNEIRKYL
jgi:Flp pilus assembly protein TadB